MRRLQNHESKQRGSLDFPLEYHYLDRNHPRYQMPYHWHEEYEILHILEGSFELTLDDKVITLAPGDIAFIAAEQIHGGMPQACIYECIVFDVRMLLKCSDHCKQQINDVRHHRISLQSIYPADCEMIQPSVLPMFDALRQQSPGYELITIGCLFLFIGKVFQYGAYASVAAEDREGKKALQLKQVFEKIEESYASALSLSEMAASVHMSPKYFCRIFKAMTHRTPIDYLIYYRIEVACNEIAATDKSLTEIALDTGFSNVNYFIRQFKKKKGVTPGQYMERIRSTSSG